MARVEENSQTRQKNLTIKKNKNKRHSDYFGEKRYNFYQKGKNKKNKAFK